MMAAILKSPAHNVTHLEQRPHDGIDLSASIVEER